MELLLSCALLVIGHLDPRELLFNEPLPIVYVPITCYRICIKNLHFMCFHRIVYQCNHRSGLGHRIGLHTGSGQMLCNDAPVLHI